MKANLTAVLIVFAAAFALAPEPAFAWGGNTPISDCNDNESSIHPGAAEDTGNGIDDNCNGLADEVGGMPSSNSLDEDADAWGITQGDCNDHNPQVNPGLVESVGDRVDNDCDGLGDEAANNTPSSDTTDQDGDGYTMANDRVFGDLFEANQ